LNDLALKYDTDKAKKKGDALYHGYTEEYEKVFDSVANKETSLFEIGVLSGSSLRMWAEYFINGKIYGMDLFHRDDHMHIQEQLASTGIITFKGSQRKREDLYHIMENIGHKLDIIIDDGSHWNDDIRISLGTLFPYLKSGGHYIIEDSLYGDEKNKQKKAKKSKVHKIVPNILTLGDMWARGRDLDCEVISEEELDYLAENIESWEFKCKGKLNIIKKK
tara:strand:+ start:8780 stop:9439 length:660 start_codon:yes stop_codon:yes gene_type:complete